MTVIVKHRILIVVSLLTTLVAVIAPRVAQDPLYHQFADLNSFFGIPSTLNVLSSLLFAWIGIDGLRLLRQNSLCVENGIYPAYPTFFAALVLVAVGSAYYHWHPDNQTLIWDRLLITIAFMSFFSILIAERISLKLARNLFPLLLLLGIASIVYWHLSEQAGRGDLRPYALIQFLPILLTPLILLMLDSRYTRSSDIWWFLAWYLLAKVFEAFDAELLDWLVVISGHSLKHVAAGIGCLIYLRHLRLRTFKPQ